MKVHFAFKLESEFCHEFPLIILVRGLQESPWMHYSFSKNYINLQSYEVKMGACKINLW